MLKTALCIASINGVGANNEKIIAGTTTDVALKYLRRAAGARSSFGLFINHPL
jgi:hypothetical protein